MKKKINAITIIVLIIILLTGNIGLCDDSDLIYDRNTVILEKE